MIHQPGKHLFLTLQVAGRGKAALRPSRIVLLLGMGDFSKFICRQLCSHVGMQEAFHKTSKKRSISGFVVVPMLSFFKRLAITGKAPWTPMTAALADIFLKNLFLGSSVLLGICTAWVLPVWEALL